MIAPHTVCQLEEIAQYFEQKKSYSECGIGYSTGALGAFLFIYKYCSFFDNVHLMRKGQVLLQDTIRKALTEPVSQLGEATEFGLLMFRLVEEGYLSEEFDFIFTKIDDLLYAQLFPVLDRCDFDQFTGYLTIARYFLKRGQQSALANAGLQAVIDKLLASSHHSEQGSYWRSQFLTRNLVYFGWSHGLASILLFLASYVQQGGGYRLAEVKAVLQECVRFVRNSAAPALPNMYPDTMGEAKSTGTFNLCYGDMGVVYALWRAAAALKDAAAQQQATKHLLQLAERREAASCHVYDASVLYGASGNMLFFNSLFTETKQHAFEVAAAYWREQAQQLSRHPGCVAGYKNHYNKSLPQTYSSFFEGLAGYGLAQLEYETEELGLLELIGY